MKPGWERHDYARYAASLPAVKRLRRMGRLMVAVTITSIGLPLVVGLSGAPRVVILLTPWISMGLLYSPAFASPVLRAFRRGLCLDG